MTILPRFLLEHKNSSHFFEICLPPEDSLCMNALDETGCSGKF